MIALRWSTALFAIIMLATTVLWVAPTSAVRAATSTDDIAVSLRADPVLNDPTAENALTPGQADDLRRQIAATGEPFFIAVLPAADLEQPGVGPVTPDALLAEIRTAVGASGTYAIIVGNSFRAGATDQSVTGIASEAFAQQSANGPYAVLSTFIDGVGGSANTTDGSSTAIVLVVLLIVGVIIAIVLVLAQRSKRRIEQQRLAQVGATLHEDITELGERIGRFDHHDARLSDASRLDLSLALDSYTKASSTSANLRRDTDVIDTTRALDEGRFALARVEAQLNGQEPPGRRPPCFFDPRHGVSFADVPWVSNNGTSHPVPACAECVTLINQGQHPIPREVEVDGQRRPYYDAGPAYAPYARGYFDNFAGMLPAIFMGTMLAQAFTMPAAMAATDTSGGFGGGDFGGGGFGGGDFGGGGFGGGDF